MNRGTTSSTRAKGRSKFVEQVLARKGARFYLFDWNGVALDRHTYIEMSDPFDTYEDASDQWNRPIK